MFSLATLTRGPLVRHVSTRNTKYRGLNLDVTLGRSAVYFFFISVDKEGTS